MFDKEAKNIDAVTVSTPDHMHGTAAMWAMARGKHVYCQKPLTRTVWEAHELTLAAAKYGVATQMGNQGYSNEGARQCCEMIWNGDIGDVTEVHAWTDRPVNYWPQGPDVVPAEAPVPSTLDWDVWLGGAEPRPYSPAYVPHNWRGFPGFRLRRHRRHGLSHPWHAEHGAALDRAGQCRVRRAGRQVKVHLSEEVGSPLRFPRAWQDAAGQSVLARRAGRQPEFHGVPEGELLGDSDINGSLFIGDKGMMTTGCYGETYAVGARREMKDYKMPPQLLPRARPRRSSPGHYRDWIRACKGGEPACSNFSVAGPFVQWMLLGVIAMKSEGKLDWDAQKMAGSRTTRRRTVPEAELPERMEVRVERLGRVARLLLAIHQLGFTSRRRRRRRL